VDLADGVILGHELLLCLTQDDGTEDLPPGLIEVAEESGLITEIDAVTLRTALELLGGPYSAAGMLNVKISARTIQHPGFADMIAKVGLEAGAARCRLGVELTEKVLLESEQIAARAIDLLHDVGFRVGLDQFGTGHYALVDLRRFKLDFIKIDRSFVAELASDEDAAPDMLKVFLDIGATFGFDVIAEGVDTPRQAGTLLVLGCRSGQGEDLGSILSVSEYMQKDGPVSPVNGEETFEVALVSGSDRRATLSSRR
jgi:EAL domain-containing protein (putative c-di-GMP-specific phosphodiesterase class I)